MFMQFIHTVYNSNYYYLDKRRERETEKLFLSNKFKPRGEKK